MLTPKEKHERIREALRMSPLGVSVCAWKEHNGIYYKDEGDTDNHWTVIFAYDGLYPLCFDSYEPFIKKLDKDYDFGFAKRCGILRLTPVANPSCSLLNFLRNVYKINI